MDERVCLDVVCGFAFDDEWMESYRTLLKRRGSRDALVARLCRIGGWDHISPATQFERSRLGDEVWANHVCLMACLYWRDGDAGTAHLILTGVECRMAELISKSLIRGIPFSEWAGVMSVMSENRCLAFAG